MRMILADQNQKTLWALATVLQEEPGLEIVGEAADAEGLLLLAVNALVDLILLDKQLAGAQIAPLISELHTLDPRPAVFGMSSDSDDGRLMLKAGADAFVSKGDQPDWLLDMLRNYAKRHQEGVESK